MSLVSLLVDHTGGGADAEYKFFWTATGTNDADHAVEVVGYTEDGREKRAQGDDLAPSAGEATITGSGEGSDPPTERYFAKIYLYDKTTGDVIASAETRPTIRAD